MTVFYTILKRYVEAPVCLTVGNAETTRKSSWLTHASGLHGVPTKEGTYCKEAKVLVVRLVQFSCRLGSSF